MKTCANCGQALPLSEFYAQWDHRWQALRTRAICKPCVRAHRKDSGHNKRAYAQRRDIDLARAAAARAAADAFVNEYKRTNPCTDCGNYLHPAVMDFDHIPGRGKKRGISRLKQYRLEIIKDEIAKCELVCSNCHRMRTWNRIQQAMQAGDPYPTKRRPEDALRPADQTRE